MRLLPENHLAYGGSCHRFFRRISARADFDACTISGAALHTRRFTTDSQRSTNFEHAREMGENERRECEERFT